MKYIKIIKANLFPIILSFFCLVSIVFSFNQNDTARINKIIAEYKEQQEKIHIQAEKTRDEIEIFSRELDLLNQSLIQKKNEWNSIQGKIDAYEYELGLVQGK